MNPLLGSLCLLLPCPVRRLKPLRAALVALVLVLHSAAAVAQPDERSMFNRQTSAAQIEHLWQWMLEFPVTIRPQVLPDARIVANDGVNYVVSYRPEGRIYTSRSYGFARMEWEPGDAARFAHVNQYDITQILNFTIARTFVVSLGAGLGLMDGFTVNQAGDVQTRLELFMPVQFGLAVQLGRRFVASAKMIQSSFFSPGPVVSAARGLVGFGYNY